MGPGLIHPSDLDAWQGWHESRKRLRRHTRRVRPAAPAVPATASLLLPPGGEADVVVVVEATHASVVQAVAAPLCHLPVARTAVVCPPGWAPPAGYADHSGHAVEPGDVQHHVSPSVVLSAGHYSALGAAGLAVSQRSGAGFFVSQHGALTPYAPPLPPEARLLAWSEADAEFWRSGRRDVSHQVVGSQLLWQVGQQERGPRTDDGQALTYLGQLHAAELSRSRLSHAAADFCRRHAATYRPHPSERDKLSRWTHAGYRRLGIPVDGSPALSASAGPVVSVFSTGVLEAATQGRAAWVDFPRPPAWLGEFWERYGMHRFGGDPTPAPPVPETEPARRIAEILLEAVR